MKRRQGKRLQRMTALVLTCSILMGSWGPSAAERSEELPPVVQWTPQTVQEQEESPILPVIVEEDLGKRGEYEKHFLCDDGSYMAVSYPEPVHMRQGTEWVDIEYAPAADGQNLVSEELGSRLTLASRSAEDEDLVGISAEGYDIKWTVEATKPAASVALPGGGAAMAAVPAAEPAIQALAAVDAQVVTSLELTERNVEEPTHAEITAVLGTKADALEELGELESSEPELWTREQKLLVETVNEEIQALNQSRIEAVTFAASMVEYPAALGTGTTLRYMVSPGKLKEEIVLESADTLESYQVTMDTDGLTAVADPDGGIRLCDGEGTAIFTIAPPLLYDAADETSRDVEVTVEQSGDECVLTYTPDREWITDPARVWPVVIDPTVTSASVAQQQQIDTYVYHGQTSPMNSSADKLYIGQYSRNGSLREHGAYWRLNTLPTLPSGANIIGASLHFRLSNGTSSMGSIEVWTAETSWDSTTLTWSNKPDPETFLGDIDSLPSGSAKWLVYDSVWVKDAVIDWYASPANNHGVLLWHGLCIDDYNTIYSADYRPSGSTAYIPYLAVSYADIVPVSQVCVMPESLTMDVADIFYLSGGVLPKNATNQTVYYTSSNPYVATVNYTSGLVNAKAEGTTIITVRSAADSSKYATCTITVDCQILDTFNENEEELTRILRELNSLLDDYLQEISPPRYCNGIEITSENKNSLNHNGVNIYEFLYYWYEEHIWPYEQKLPDWIESASNPRTHEGTKRAALDKWLERVYGETTWEKIVNGFDDFVEVLYYEIVDIGDTLSSAIRQIVGGNYSDDVTIMGTAGQIILSVLGFDLVADLRDVHYDVTHWEMSWSHVGQTSVDLVAFLPLIGTIKNIDELKLLSKTIDSIDDLAKDTKKLDLLLQEVDDMTDLLKRTGKLGDYAQDTEFWVKVATRKGDIDDNIVMLGKFEQKNGKELATSYSAVARAKGYAYYSMPQKTWEALKSILEDNGMWLINKSYLEKQADLRKTFYFSHNPYEFMNEQKSFGREIRYLLDDLHYTISKTPNAEGFYYATPPKI